MEEGIGQVREHQGLTIGEFVQPTAQRYKGMFNVYVQEGRYFVEIPKRLLGRDIAAM